jgi:hypothetical protein
VQASLAPDTFVLLKASVFPLEPHSSRALAEVDFGYAVPSRGQNVTSSCICLGPHLSSIEDSVDEDAVPTPLTSASPRVHFEGLQPNDPNRPVDLRLSWLKRGGTRVFRPAPDLKLQASM